MSSIDVFSLLVYLFLFLLYTSATFTTKIFFYYFESMVSIESALSMAFNHVSEF